MVALSKQRSKVWLKRSLYRQGAVVEIVTNHDMKIIEALKSIPGIQRNAAGKCFYMAENIFDLRNFTDRLKPIADTDPSALPSGYHRNSGSENPRKTSSPNRFQTPLPPTIEFIDSIKELVEE